MDQLPITVSVNEFVRMSGICRSRVYQLMNEGTLASIGLGRKRLILVESYRRLVADRLEAERRTNVATGAAAPQHQSA